jgi:hypothetical protein
VELISVPALNFENTEHELVDDINFDVGEFFQENFIIFRIHKREAFGKQRRCFNEIFVF